MSDVGDESRRDLLRRVPMVGAGLAVISWGGVEAAVQKQERKEKGEEEVSPAEDLMREHGVLNRILLIYGEAIRRMAGREEMPAETLHEAATIIHSFIEDYHEKLEEQFLFPRFEKANRHVELVKTLKTQHDAGRRLTDEVLRLAKQPAMKEADDRKKLSESLHAFIHMYRPHEAREDTVLFPALHGIVSPNEYGALGEQFERREHELFGKEGFEGIVEKVAGIEKKLGIYDLAKFTPR